MPTAQPAAWVDMAVALGEQARAVAINRIVGGNPPTAAQFNTSKQFLDIVEQGMLTPMDEVALRDGWDKFLPEIVLNAVRVKGHYYAVPVNIHMPTWLWYSKAALQAAGVAAEPKSMDELFAALDKLKAAGLVGLAHGGQSWQDNTSSPPCWPTWAGASSTSRCCATAMQRSSSPTPSARCC
jgi:glucose/mannose transport system substrate-binding protein